MIRLFTKCPKSFKTLLICDICVVQKSKHFLKPIVIPLKKEKKIKFTIKYSLLTQVLHSLFRQNMLTRFSEMPLKIIYATYANSGLKDVFKI